jgi:hypothetical protein
MVKNSHFTDSEQQYQKIYYCLSLERLIHFSNIKNTSLNEKIVFSLYWTLKVYFVK